MEALIADKVAVGSTSGNIPQIEIDDQKRTAVSSSIAISQAAMNGEVQELHTACATQRSWIC